ncbi:MAG: DinB family protein [Parcubacteria group bacterium]|nr:DinB family protein [Parcubacteria group bacterium]
MNNKDFFLKTLEEEAPKFRVAIDALPEDKYEHKVHERSRAAGNLAAQLGLQWKAISGIITAGAPAFNPHEMENQSKEDMLSAFDKGMAQLQKDVQEISLEDWENGDANMGDVWKDKKYHMAWGFLFDAIHHRGQLATYLRAMGAVVPSIYGPSADTQN